VSTHDGPTHDGPALDASTLEGHIADIEAAPLATFLRVDSMTPKARVQAGLMVSRGELVRVTRGLYWKGLKTPLGMSGPGTVEMAVEFGGVGSGFSGYAAANGLGLTTQVPARVYVAMPGRAHRDVRWMHFVSRGLHRRDMALSSTEVTVIEALRGWAAYSEVSMARGAPRLSVLFEEGKVRRDVISAVFEIEWQGRTAWQEFSSYLG
jgi:hypothetical protein